MQTRIAFNEWRTVLPDAPFRVRRAVHAALRPEAEPGGVVCVLLTDDREMRVLNRRFRKCAHATDVLCFPAAATPALALLRPPLGDIALGLQSVQEGAVEARQPLFQHFAHLVIHGMLHIQGFHHSGAAETARMRACEREAMRSLGFPDPWGRPQTQGASTGDALGRARGG